MTDLFKIWKRLQCVSRFSFRSSSANWERIGGGGVKVGTTFSHLLFEEKGEWKDEILSLTFTNRLRWGLGTNSLSLEHMRQGDPIFLLDFVTKKGRLLSREDHLCGHDRYKGEIRIAGSAIRLNWTVNGPKKSERIEIVYL